MDSLVWLGIVCLVIFALANLFRSVSKKSKSQKQVYKYLPKDSLMTKSEMEFFWKLIEVVKDRYYIFPQVHLSALLDHKVAGQEWKYAFYHINGKSVDYVLCSQTTLQPMYAIELDDPSHDRPDRIARDTEVERIFDEANIPLVRFRDYKSLSRDAIAHALADASTLTNSRR